MDELIKKYVACTATKQEQEQVRNYLLQGDMEKYRSVMLQMRQRAMDELNIDNDDIMNILNKSISSQGVAKKMDIEAAKTVPLPVEISMHELLSNFYIKVMSENL